MHNTFRVLITGRVQGVGYRAWTVTTATHLGVGGWVRNLESGEVEAVFSGTEAKLEEMIESCKQGPNHAVVDKIEIFSYKDEVAPGLFSAKPTASSSG